MSAPLFETVTRSVRVIDVPTAVRNAIVTHSEHQKLKLIEAQAWITLRTKAAKPNFLGKILRRPAPKEPVHEMVLFIHPTHLIVGGSRGVVADAMAMSIAMVDASIVHSKNAAEKGFTISGFAGPTPTFFMGLGPGADADACVAALEKALLDAPAAAQTRADAKEAVADAKAASKARDAAKEAAK